MDGVQELPVFGCRLDAANLEAQRARYATLAAHVGTAEHRAGELVVDFDDGVDRDLLEQTLAIERACCTFFAIDLDGGRLTIGVQRPEQRPALDAIAHVLGV